jgi:hypothetical protein
VVPTAIAQVCWILKTIVGDAGSVPVTLDHATFERWDSGLLLWEAVVTGTHKGADNFEDARIAVEAFETGIHTLPTEIDEPCFSLVGAAAIWAGLPISQDEMQAPCLVIFPS